MEIIAVVEKNNTLVNTLNVVIIIETIVIIGLIITTIVVNKK